MLDFLTKASQRKFKLVKLLSDSRTYVSINELTATLNCKERNILDDVKELSSPELLHIFEIETRSKSYKLHMKNNMTIDAVGHHIMNDNDCFSLLDYVFFNEGLSAEELAEKNHISLPTLYRMISRINKGLKKRFHLKFETNPCRLEGDEVEVRSFYLQYFVEKYPISEWPFDNLNEDEILNVFRKITDSLNFTRQYSFLRTIKILLAVSHIRFKQGFHISGRSTRMAKLQHRLSNSPLLYKQFSAVFKDVTNAEMFNDNLAYVVTDYFYFNYEELLTHAHHDEYAARSFINLSEMFNELSKTYDIPLVNKDALIYSVHNSAQMGFKNINIRYILVDNKSFLLKQFKNLFPDFYNDIEKRIKTYLLLMELEYNSDLINHLIHNIFTRWENLLHHLYSRQRKIKIHVVSSHDIYHARLMKSILKYEFHDEIKVSVLDSIDLNELLNIDSNIDIFVVNFTIPVADKRIIAVNDVPADEDFIEIKRLIAEIRINEN
ncbi:helix-turn-helix domain-containing protein [Jeotgalicoccus nanhaiensis]|uniref:Helix-turn-helix domain-containing protein n=1 Tax=Jeotgalicoccus nanhaiensis TaxID=568603 RepID=A0ABR9XW57_9STAP|nr:helix-turn-helix domain-containing protein [Jeotgalicoccus nanhaiensis]MBF0753122.1 helix-turn-helix domain-containing protein [Jeotgalicoccus nanhaiensis]